MQQLSFTIPYTSSAIRATVVALNQMDNDLNGSVGLFEEPTFTGTMTHPASMPSAFERSVGDIIHASETKTGTPPPPSEPIDDEADEPSQPEGAVDSAGMQWDGRIHSSSKAFLKSDGTWKLKKGVDKTLLAQVQAELMGNVPVDTSPTQSNVNTPLPQVEAIVETTPPPPTTVAPAVPTAEATVPNPNAFRQLLSEITKAGLAPDYVQTTCREVNGCTLPECKDDMDKLAMLRMSLGL